MLCYLSACAKRFGGCLLPEQIMPMPVYVCDYDDSLGMKTNSRRQSGELRSRMRVWMHIMCTILTACAAGEKSQYRSPLYADCFLINYVHFSHVCFQDDAIANSVTCDKGQLEFPVERNRHTYTDSNYDKSPSALCAPFP